MKIAQFYGMSQLQYELYKPYIIYDSNNPNNPLWFAKSILEILDINENTLIYRNLARKHKANFF